LVCKQNCSIDDRSLYREGPLWRRGENQTKRQEGVEGQSKSKGYGCGFGGV